MKTIKTILAMVLLTVATTVSYGGDTAMDAARKDLNEEITRVMKKSLKAWDNYFYQNDVNSMKEDVEISLYVDDQQNLRLLQVKCDNPDAVGYVKHIFKNESMKANKILTGKAFKFNLHLRYKTS